MEEKKRIYQAREMRLIAEWIAKNYPDAHYKLNVRLGSLHPRLKGQFLSEEEQRMVGVWRRFADCIIFLKDELLLVEAVIRPQPGKISTLLVYKKLVDKTPDLREFWSFPVKMVLLCAINDPVITELAREQEIEVQFFRPAWVDKYMEQLYPRERGPSLTTFERT